MTEQKPKSPIPFIIAFTVLLVAYFMPEMGMIKPTGWRALAILLSAIILWATEALPAANTAMGILVLLPLLGVSSYTNTFSSLGTVMIWRLVSIFIITEAVRRVGLANRIAYKLIIAMKGYVRRMLLCVLLLGFAFSFVLPSISARTSLLVILVVSWMQTINIKPPSNIGKAFMISIPAVCTLTASSIIVGASVDIFAADLFNTLIGYRWTYFTWLITTAPICLIFTLAVYAVIILLFKPEINRIDNITEIQEKSRAMGSITRQEKFVIIIFLILLALWITDTAEVIPAEMMAAFILVFPSKLRILTWKEAMNSVQWPIILLFGASISMAAALQGSGIVDWLGINVFSQLVGLSPVIIALITIVTTVLLRLGMSNMTGVIATLLPLLITLAKGVNVNPVWLGMICVMSSSSSFFFPAQSAHMLFTYGYGFYSNQDLLKFGLVLFPLFVLILILMAIIYWPVAIIPVNLLTQG